MGEAVRREPWARRTPRRAPRRTVRAPLLACLAALAISPVPAAADTTASQWLELVHACTAVISDQSLGPLQGYDPAPFSMGLPGRKEYAVYNEPRTLVAIARVVRDDWVHCLVRESVENDRARWREVSAEWSKVFPEGFPQPEFRWVRAVFNPDQPFLGAVRCKDGSLVVRVMPNLAANLHFRIEIDNDPPLPNWNVCAEGDGS